MPEGTGMVGGGAERGVTSDVVTRSDGVKMFGL